MTAPDVAFSHFAHACVLGGVLGIWYDFLRPFRCRHRVLGDVFFLLGFGWAWLILGFGICGGDLRLGYDAGLFAGGFLWEWLLGRHLTGIFARIWSLIWKIWGLIWFPVKNLRFLQNFCLHLEKNGLQ